MSNALYARFLDRLCACPALGLSLDLSRLSLPDDFLPSNAHTIRRAYDAMDLLERGATANPDENRRVGHYWLRAPQLAPDPAITKQIVESHQRIEAFASDLHAHRVKPRRADRFTDLLVIGIGGSALGPQLVADALGDPLRDKMAIHFLDNTDPDGIDRALASLGPRLASTLTLVVSKSGSTPETRNGMLLADAAYRRMGLEFAPHAVAITAEGSALDKTASDEGWLLRLPMWDFVGGRTSELSAVGLLPAALQGIDTASLLRGAAACDAATRSRETKNNPAALLALAWHHATNGRGAKHMVVLPYKDRLALLGRYLQQLVMESIGKGRDLDGQRVEQGLTVYGNKGSTDQHAYVQQLREGVNNFFALFIRVLEDGGSAQEVEPGVTAGDYLDGFWLGTRQALTENHRESITLTLDRVDAFHLGVLIALFERTVGFYATLVNVNAYNQPGVEAGKKAAADLLDLQRQILAYLHKTASPPPLPQQLANELRVHDRAEDVHHILAHLRANGRIH